MDLLALKYTLRFDKKLFRECNFEFLFRKYLNSLCDLHESKHKEHSEDSLKTCWIGAMDGQGVRG